MVAWSSARVERHTLARGPLSTLNATVLNAIKNIMGPTSFNKLDCQLRFTAELNEFAAAKHRLVTMASLGQDDRIHSSEWIRLRQELRPAAAKLQARLAILRAVQWNGEHKPATIRGGGSIDGQLATVPEHEASNRNPNSEPSPKPRP